VELFSSVSRTNPEDVHVYNRLGIAYRKQGNFREAIAEYKKALQVDPEDENLCYNLGRAYLEADMIADAKAQFSESPGIKTPTSGSREDPFRRSKGSQRSGE